ncbi:MAG TPA: DUF4440 domain-containing protein, partial [Longimicrobium sp.]|nr:DUF4440 domain-containing protein [Longimicrobium sp.]
GARAGSAADPSPGASTSMQNEITALMQASADGWNRGSLDEFMVPYLDSPTITYITGPGVARGKTAIRDFYAGSWFRGGQPAGRLSYRDIEARPLGRDFALVVGGWTVTRADGREQKGIFSLTMQRTPEGWRIIHDHSS